MCEYLLPEKYRRDVESEYELGDTVGTPGCTAVTKVSRHKKTLKSFAIKCIDKASINPETKPLITREIDIMESLPIHPNIIKFETAFENEKYIYIVMELCQGGELFDRIILQRGYCEKDAAHVAFQMASAIDTLHKHGITHCDLKPDNWVYDKPGLNLTDGTLKLIDFGLSRKESFLQYHTDPCGTPYYLAPEVLYGEYNSSSDVWSIGVIIFMLVYGYPCFSASFAEQNDNEYLSEDELIIRCIIKGFTPEVKESYGPWFPKNIPTSPALQNLISRILTDEIDNRITAEEMLSHKWLIGECFLDPIPITVQNSLKFFRTENQFKTMILYILTDNMNDTELKELSEIFSMMDKNKDGVVSVNELQEALIKRRKHISEKKPLTPKPESFPVVKPKEYGSRHIDTATRKPIITRKAPPKPQKQKNNIFRMQTSDFDLIPLCGPLSKKHTVWDILKEADLDGDRVINFQELLVCATNRKVIQKQERMRNAFDLIDLQKTGFITKSDLGKLIENSGISIEGGTLNDIFTKVDKNNDGKICFEEFVNAFGIQNGKTRGQLDVSKIVQTVEKKNKVKEKIKIRKAFSLQPFLTTVETNPWDFWHSKSRK